MSMYTIQKKESEQIQMKRRILAMALACVLCLSALFVPASAAAGGASGLQQVLAKAKDSVASVWVVGYGADGTVQGYGTGTCFAVGQAGQDTDVFVTNWHVVKLDGNFPVENTRVWIMRENCGFQSNYEPDPNNSIECRVMKTTSGYPDYAIIKTQKPVSGYKALPLLSATKVEKGTQVYALGFPGIVEAYSVERFGGENLTATDGIVSRHGQLSVAGNTSVLFHTAKITGGNSGGPLITKDGAVVGINTYGLGEETSSDYSCAVYIDYAMEGLDELGISYTIYSRTWVVILIAAAGAVLIAAVVIILLLQKKKRDEAERLRREEAQRKQRELAEQRAREQAEQRRLNELSGKIHRIEQANKFRLVSGDGRTYAITAPVTLIGRDPSCQIRFPEDAKGISRKHCQLVIQGDCLALTDLGSSFGTFIHGKKIPVNTPVALHAGSSFCLGGPDSNLFTVQ